MQWLEHWSVGFSRISFTSSYWWLQFIRDALHGVEKHFANGVAKTPSFVLTETTTCSTWLFSTSLLQCIKQDNWGYWCFSAKGLLEGDPCDRKHPFGVGGKNLDGRGRPSKYLYRPSLLFILKGRSLSVDSPYAETKQMYTKNGQNGGTIKSVTLRSHSMTILG